MWTENAICHRLSLMRGIKPNHFVIFRSRSNPVARQNAQNIKSPNHFEQMKSTNCHRRYRRGRWHAACQTLPGSASARSSLFKSSAGMNIEHTRRLSSRNLGFKLTFLFFFFSFFFTDSFVSRLSFVELFFYSLSYSTLCSFQNTKMPMNVAEAKEMLLRWAKAKTKEYDVSLFSIANSAYNFYRTCRQ